MNRGNRRPSGKRIVCFCYNVPEDEIIAAIQGGVKTLLELRRVTNANSGCGGCGEDCKKLLRKYASGGVEDPEFGEDT